MPDTTFLVCHQMAFAEGDGGVIEFVLEVKDGIVHFAKIVVSILLLFCECIQYSGCIFI